MRNLLERWLPTPTKDAQIASLREDLGVERNNLELFTESFAQLQLAMEDVGWHRLLAGGEHEFSREGLRQISAVCRLFATANPLIKRGVSLRTIYVWGQGVEVSARANGRSNRNGEQDVNTVLQAFLDDAANRRTFTASDAQTRLERGLATDGNLFLSLWTKPTSGRVTVRLLPYDEIDDVICNPDDASEPWFYPRKWREEIRTVNGAVEVLERQALYPAVTYRPKSRPKTWNGWEVRWDAPVRHVKVNDLDGWKFGVGDAYAAIAWARGYKEFLEDWARLVKSLSRFAWRTTAKGAAQAQQIRAKLTSAPVRNVATGERDTVGATAVVADDRVLEAIPKSGATIDSESGKPLAAMVAAALGVPVTMLLADPGQTGARATAETLDQPTELEMESRRSLWTEVLRDVCEHVVREAVRAPKGQLKGSVKRDDDDREYVELAGDTEQTIDVAWPDLKAADQAGTVDAIVKAASTMTMPPEIILRLLLTALGVQHVDELVDEMTDENGTFMYPDGPQLGDGQAAADAERDGGDPAEVGDGAMGGDGDADGDASDSGDGSQAA